ncbi:MAG TPA: TRAP transporter small permease [Methylomirabilota bacterium]|jgi:C4-dicarboxylate transporter DctQ subunit|nr:TRAP transporter small permease [Methylomirabilota bacterium]
MRRSLRLVVRLCEWWSVLLLFLMVAIVVVGVFYRYVLDASLAWYDEFASYLLVWLTFYGAVVVSYHRRQISFETLAESLGPRGRRAVMIVAELLVLAFQVILTYYGWVALDAMAFDIAVSIPWVRMTWIYSVLPISGALMLLISVLQLADLVRGAPPAPPAPAVHRTAE